MFTVTAVTALAALGRVEVASNILDAVMRNTLGMNVRLRSRLEGHWVATLWVVLTGIWGTVSCSTPLPPDDVQRSMFDRSIAWAQIQTTVDLYNQHIAGKLAGAVDVNVSCPNGGTARITGTVTTPGNVGTTTVDLTFDMNACYHTSLRTTGIITKTASFSATTNTANYQSLGNLAVSGTLKIVINSTTQLEPAIDESCAFAASTTTTQATGTYCGRPFSY